MYTLKPNEKPDYAAEYNNTMLLSECDHTMVGFVTDKSVKSSLAQHHVTCFYAEKDQKNLYEDQVLAQKKLV